MVRVSAYRLAVVQVRRDQQDSQQFWLAVLSAIRQASGATGEGEPLAATPDFNEAAISERVLSELAAHHDRTFLIIDDLHELTSAEALTAADQAAAEAAPARARDPRHAT